MATAQLPQTSQDPRVADLRSTGDGAPDAYGLPEPPERGSQDSYGAPPAAPPEAEALRHSYAPTPAGSGQAPYGGAYLAPVPYFAPPPPAGSGVPPYVGGQPPPTPYPSAYPAGARVAGGPGGYPPRPGGFGPPSGGYHTPTGIYLPYQYGFVDPFAKSRTVAGVLGILLGGLGVHRFYLGYVGVGLAQIAATVFTFGLGALWGFIEGILYLTQRTGQFSVDATGRPLRE